jgi:IS30 family transposase
MQYKHLSQKEREELFVLLQEGWRKNTIAKLIHRHPATIGREIRRNSTSIDPLYNGSPKKKKHYLPDNAQAKYRRRRKESKYAFPLKKPWIYKYTIKYLKQRWSPEQIAGRIIIDLEETISPECIYQFIYSKRGQTLRLSQYLPRGYIKRRKRHGRKVRKRTVIPNRVDISLRPKEVDFRERYGDWEGDTIVGLAMKKGPALHTLVNRKLRLVFIRKVYDKSAAETARVMKEILNSLPDYLKQTVTVDNGSEFCDWEEVSKKTDTAFYFTKPYHAWEKGTNENTNGLIRYYFPKKTDFNFISEEKIQQVQDIINHRPRKCLDYKKPIELYNHILSTHNKKIALEN